jgi:hypothetical protein
MRDPPSAQQAAMNKSLAQNNKSRTGGKATKKTEPPMNGYSDEKMLAMSSRIEQVSPPN